MISKMNGWAGAKKTKMQDSGELLSSTAAPFGYSNYRSEMRAFAHKKINTSTKGTKLSKDTIVNSIYSCTVHVCNWYNRTIKLYTGLSENFFAFALNEADPFNIHSETPLGENKIFSPDSRCVPTYGSSQTGLCNKVWPKVRNVKFELFHT